MLLGPLRPEFFATRSVAQRIGTHLMSRARKAATGRVDLAPMPGGFGTPAFGADHRVIRVDGDALIIESTGDPVSTRIVPINRTTLAVLADAAGVVLTDDFDVGHDTPKLGNVHAPLSADGTSMTQMGAWFALGSMTIDRVLGSLEHGGTPGRTRIWPEHFDLGVDVAAASGTRVNLGASVGDSSHAEPYLYVGPWEPLRPGDDGYWNASFGAVLSYSEVLAAEDPLAMAVAFMREGIDRLA